MKKSDTPTQVTLADGTTQSAGINLASQQTTQSGAGVLPERYTYDPNTGALTNLKLFQSGTLDGGGAESTTWTYDPTTGLLTSKTFNDGTSDVYSYNAKNQLTGVTEPFATIAYHYDSAGRQISSTATDNVSGNAVTDTTGGYDDQGRATSVTQTQTDPGGGLAYSNTNAYTYTPQGDLQSETQAGGTTTFYTYYPTTFYGTGGAPDALESVKIVHGTTTLSETDYTYDANTGRLATVTTNGQTFSYGYKSGTNLVASVGDAMVATSFTYGAQTGLLTGIATGSEGLNLYSAGYTYNANQQRQTETVAQQNPDGSASDQDLTYGYDSAEELNSVTDTNTGAPIFGATYDGAGNRSDSGFTTTYGVANGMNQYANITYNARGDELDDGTLNYGWDAQDELTSEAPDHPATGSTEEEFQYDASQRRTEEDIFNYNGTTGQWDAEADKVLKFAYQGSNLVAEFNGANQLITSLAYGAGTSLLAVTDYTGASPKTYEVVQDGSGSVVALVDPTTGAVDASFQYSPTGIRTYAAGPAVNVCPYGFEGLIFDGSGLNYYGWHRYYSPQFGKWISRDPVAEAGGLDTGEYANNDPINQNDVTGLAAGDEPGIVQLWHAAKEIAMQPGYVTAINTAEYWLPKAQTAANDFVYSQSTPTTRVVAEMGRSAGEAKATAHIFTGAIELQDTGNEAVSWLATGSTDALPSASPFGPHPLSRAVDRAVDQAFQPASSLDPRAFNSGQLVGNVQVQGSILVASAALPFTGFGEVGIAAEASTAIGLLEDGAEAAEVFNFANGAAAGLEAATPGAAIQDVAVESQLITADLAQNAATEPIRAGEITTLQDFTDRSVVGDNLEGHELWQHANLRAQGLATDRLSTAASQNNPVIALDRAVHQQVSVAQRTFDATEQTPFENISANAAIMRDLNVVPESATVRLQQMAVQHAQNLGY